MSDTTNERERDREAQSTYGAVEAHSNEIALGRDDLVGDSRDGALHGVVERYLSVPSHRTRCYEITRREAILVAVCVYLIVVVLEEHVGMAVDQEDDAILARLVALLLDATKPSTTDRPKGIARTLDGSMAAYVGLLFLTILVVGVVKDVVPDRLLRERATERTIAAVHGRQRRSQRTRARRRAAATRSRRARSTSSPTTHLGY